MGELHLKKSLEEETGALRNLCAFNELISSLPCCKADRDDMSNIVCDSYLRCNSPRNEKPSSFTLPRIMTSFPPWNTKGKALKNVLECHYNKGELELSGLKTGQKSTINLMVLFSMMCLEEKYKWLLHDLIIIFR